MNNEWKEKIAAAAVKYDGHVTNGSLAAQETVVDQMLDEFIARLRLISSQCLAGGHKSRSRMFQALAKSFEVRYRK
jgi:hypothetical protein